MQTSIKERSIPDYLLYGFAISSIGGPLALVTMNLLNQPGGLPLGIAAFIAAILFAFPIMVWYGYSEKIASSGGLYSFVKEAAGEKIAKAQGWIFILSYFLYLPYTVTYGIYFLLPVVWPGYAPYAPFLEMLVPLAICAIMLKGIKASLKAMLAIAVVQVVVLLIFIVGIYAKTGVAAASQSTTASLPNLFGGASGIALLFICSSLIVFLGGEAKGGTKSMKKAILYPFILVAVFIVLAAFAISRMPQSLTNSANQTELPGFIVSTYYLGHNAAIVVGILAIVSTFGIIIAEFVALSRLSYVMITRDMNKILIIISALFLIFDAASLLNPVAFYNYLILPSLLALFISQLIVFIVYPIYKKRKSQLGAMDIAIATVASLLMIYGLYMVISGIL